MFRCEGCGGKGTRLAIDAEEGCGQKKGEASKGTRTRHFAALAEEVQRKVVGEEAGQKTNLTGFYICGCGPIEFENLTCNGAVQGLPRLLQVILRAWKGF